MLKEIAATEKQQKVVRAAIEKVMRGHGGLLGDAVFSLTGIFHGSTKGMSSGHTCH